MGRKIGLAFLGIVVAMGWSGSPSWAQDADKSAGVAPVPAGAEEDAVAARQSVDTFGSIEDAQPNAPGHFELQIDAGWETYGHDYSPFLFRPELNYTGSGNHFLENMQLVLTTPLELGEGEVEGNGDVLLGWQQRWVAEHDGWPTLGTLIELTLPTGVESSGVDVTLMGILAKNAGRGTAYASVWTTLIGDSDDDEEDYVWGVQVGYKLPLNEQWALIANYLHESSEDEDSDDGNFLELGAEYQAAENLTIGPGIRVGLGNDDDEADFGIGLRLTYAF